MANGVAMKKSEVGELRPSQLLVTFGIGSIVDLPNLSVMVMGLDDWRVEHTQEIGEERLLLSVQDVLGPAVTQLRTPPQVEDTFGSQMNWFDESRQIGVPVAPFPRWMVCSWCRLLAPLKSGLFAPKVVPFHPDRACYVHATCAKRGKPPTALPARFVVACEKGHLDDFPWVDFVHKGHKGCPGPLYLYEVGPSGEAADVEVTCKKCGAKRRMADAFGRQNEEHMPACRGRNPHLRGNDPKGCDVEHVTPILQGASNSWFPVVLSVLSVPQATGKLGQLVERNWTILEKAQNVEMITFARQIGQLKDLAKYSDADIWEAVQSKRAGGGGRGAERSNLKSPEWTVFANPGSVTETRDFKLRTVDPPDDYVRFFEKIVLAEKLREVRASVGFTRIDSARDFDSPFEIPTDRRAPLCRGQAKWVPASETRGEGIFFQFSEPEVQRWEARVEDLDREFMRAHRMWRAAKELDPEKGYTGIRYVLLHTFGHALIRQLAVECGYTAASIAERIYSHRGAADECMAGVLIYTAAPDSEGTLGGLCALGHPDRLGRHLTQALNRMGLCASDPLCAEHEGTKDRSLHRAACHACSFLPETSCERGNKYLDRSVLVKTVERARYAFFE